MLVYANNKFLRVKLIGIITAMIRYKCFCGRKEVVEEVLAGH